MNLPIDPSEVRLPDYGARQRILAAGYETAILPGLRAQIAKLEQEKRELQAIIDTRDGDKSSMKGKCDEIIRRIESENERLRTLVTLNDLALETEEIHRAKASRADLQSIKIFLSMYAQAEGISVSAIIGPSRSAWLIPFRHAAFYETAVAFPSVSISKLARKVFSRDHTTIMHGIRKHARIHGLPLPSQFVYLNASYQRQQGAILEQREAAE